MIYNHVSEMIGNTPIVRLNRIASEEAAQIYVKLEYFNPSGSVKDRAALGMIAALERTGALREGMTIVEPTSGNTGIGIAMLGAAKGYKVVLTMPDTLSVERRRMLGAYGAELILTKGTEGMRGAIEKAEQLVRENGYVMLSQFDNPANPDIHRQTTAREILAELADLDAFVCGVGTGGTISGVGSVLKELRPELRIYAVEPEKSAVLSGGAPSPHKLQGIGAGFVPGNYSAEIVDEVLRVGEEDAYEMTRALAQREGLFVGVSSGAAVWAATVVAQRLGRGKKVLAIAPDGGSRYLSVEGLF